MNEQPQTTFMRRGQAVAWLAEHGISEHEFDKLCAAGTIRGITLRPGGRKHFLTAEIRENILGKAES